METEGERDRLDEGGGRREERPGGDAWGGGWAEGTEGEGGGRDGWVEGDWLYSALEISADATA